MLLEIEELNDVVVEGFVSEDKVGVGCNLVKVMQIEFEN